MIKTDDENVPGLYILTAPNGKKYVGISSNSIKSRLDKYRRLNCTSQKKLYNALVKYGFDSFTIEMYECHDEILLKSKEVEMISLLDTFRTGLNMTIGGEGSKGAIRSQETRIKLSNAKKGQIAWNKGIKGQIAWNKGIPMTEETRIKLSNAKKGQRLSKEMYEQQAKSRSGEKHWLYGKTHSDETKSKISKSLSGDKHPYYGKKRPQSVGIKISESKYKPVKQICIETNTIIKIWPSAKSAISEGFNNSKIGLCCNGKRKSHKGFKWEYVNK